MRIDKYLKVSRIIKRREVAKTLCDNQCVLLNEHIAKPATEVDVGDIVTINSPNGTTITIEIIKIANTATADAAKDLYKVITKE